MGTSSALSEARATCDGLHRLIQKIRAAAEDLDKSGNGSYEMHALIASANSCVINLETQLTLLEPSALNDPKVSPITRDAAKDETRDAADETINLQLRKDARKGR